MRSRDNYTSSGITEKTPAMNQHLKPEPFTGLPSQDAGSWYTKFTAWLALNDWTNEPAKVANSLRLLLLPPASSWFDQLDSKVTGDVAKLHQAFKERFVLNQPSWLLEQQLWSRTMQPTEGLDSYLAAIDDFCARLGKSESDKVTSFVRGLLPSLRTYVIQQSPKTFIDAVQAARLAHESVNMVSPTTGNINAMDTAISCESTSALSRQVQELQEQVKALQMQPPPGETTVAAAVTSNVTCQLCNNRGHGANDCQLYRKRRNVPTCYYCRRRGHVERECRTKVRDRQQGQTNNSQAGNSLNQPAPSM